MPTAVTRVLHIIGSLGYGGAERTLSDLVTHLDRACFRPEVLCLFRAGELASTVEDGGVPVTVLGIRPAVAAGNWLRVSRAVRRMRPEVVHAHLPDACWYGLPAARWVEVPVRIAHVQNSYVDWPLRLRALDRLSVSFASGVIACSDAVRRFCESRLRYPAGKIRVVRNAVDLRRFDDLPPRAAARSSLGLPADRTILACVASLTPQKGHADLLKAVDTVRRHFPDLLLLLVGGGLLGQSLEDLVRRRQLRDAVSFLGAREDVPVILAASDLFVMSSHWEGLPLVLAEAGAAGIPVVATEVDGVPEIVEHGVTGLLVAPGRPHALAEAILVLLRDPDTMRRMGEAARARVTERFSVQQKVREVEAFYQELLRTSRG